MKTSMSDSDINIQIDCCSLRANKLLNNLLHILKDSDGFDQIQERFYSSSNNQNFVPNIGTDFNIYYNI